MGVYWNNNGKNGNSTIDIEDSFIISYVKKWIYSKGDTLMNADVEFLKLCVSEFPDGYRHLGAAA